MEISGFEKIISIDEFEYLSEVNQHEQCHFSCSVAENDLDNLMSKVDTECSFADGDFKFKGLVTLNSRVVLLISHLQRISVVLY